MNKYRALNVSEDWTLLCSHWHSLPSADTVRRISPLQDPFSIHSMSQTGPLCFSWPEEHSDTGCCCTKGCLSCAVSIIFTPCTKQDVSVLSSLPLVWSSCESVEITPLILANSRNYALCSAAKFLCHLLGIYPDSWQAVTEPFSQLWKCSFASITCERLRSNNRSEPSIRPTASRLLPEAAIDVTPAFVGIVMMGWKKLWKLQKQTRPLEPWAEVIEVWP